MAQPVSPQAAVEHTPSINAARRLNFQPSPEGDRHVTGVALQAMAAAVAGSSDATDRPLSPGTLEIMEMLDTRIAKLPARQERPRKRRLGADFEAAAAPAAPAAPAAARVAQVAGAAQDAQEFYSGAGSYDGFENNPDLSRIPPASPHPLSPVAPSRPSSLGSPAWLDRHAAMFKYMR